MKVCVYLEEYRDPFSAIRARTGIGTAYRNCLRALETAGITKTTDPNSNYDVLHTHWFGPRTLHHIRCARRKKKKVVVTIHSTGEDTKGIYTGSGVVSSFLPRYLRFFCTYADVITVPSKYTRNILRAYGITQRIECVTNGTRLWSNADPREVDERPLVVVSVGLVCRRKGVFDFLAVAERLPDMRFIWIGPMRKYLGLGASLQRSLRRIPNVNFTDWVDDLHGALASGDIFFFPSHEENQGIAVIEAASMGLPLVLRDLPVYDLTFIHGSNCLMGTSVAEFSTHMRTLQENTELRHTLAYGARKLARDHSLTAVGEQLKVIYSSLLNSCSRAEEC
jgi:1,2-diacylglycerol-3-alpha-glucose alpha-1,2-glucosyltransferase